MASLTVLHGDEKEAAVQLDGVETIIGRDDGCGIRLDGLGLSRRHCAILKQGARFLLRDLDSENGTWVNGERVQERELRHGDRIGLGLQAHLLFHNEQQAPTPPPEVMPAPVAVVTPPTLPELETERPVNRWLLVVILLAVLALIAALAQFSLGG